MSSDMSPRKRILRDFLHRAFNEGRGHEVILLIQWINAKKQHYQSHYAPPEELNAAKVFDYENQGQPQALRALNVLSQRYGEGVVYKNSVAVQPNTIDGDDMMLDVQEKDPDGFFDEMEAMDHVGLVPSFKWN